MVDAIVQKRNGVKKVTITIARSGDIILTKVLQEDPNFLQPICKTECRQSGPMLFSFRQNISTAVKICYFADTTIQKLVTLSHGHSTFHVPTALIRNICGRPNFESNTKRP
jgi:hypothetical protein